MVKSIMGKGIIGKWLKVCSGRRVKPMEDNKTPRDGRFKPLVCLHPSASGYFFSNDREWDIQKFREYFIEEDVMAICSIPLSRCPIDDMLLWYYNLNGFNRCVVVIYYLMILPMRERKEIRQYLTFGDQRFGD